MQTVGQRRGSQDWVQESHGGPPLPPSREPPQANRERWLAAVKAWTRLALVLPLAAFVLLLLPAEIVVKASLGPATIKPLAGHREIIALGIALLIVKLARDANRLLACWRFADVDIELTGKVDFENFTKQDYVRPVDLMREREPKLSEGALQSLLHLDAIRKVIILVIGVMTAAFIMITLSMTLADMIIKPSLSPSLSFSILGVIFGLILVAAIDVVEIVSLQWVVYREERRREALRIAWCEKEARELTIPLPDPWPPTPEVRRSFEAQLKRIRSNAAYAPRKREV